MVCGASHWSHLVVERAREEPVDLVAVSKHGPAARAVQGAPLPRDRVPRLCESIGEGRRKEWNEEGQCRADGGKRRDEEEGAEERGKERRKERRRGEESGRVGPLPPCPWAAQEGPTPRRT